jgi:hypothetical protein
MVRDDGECNLGRDSVDEAVTGFFGGHKTMQGGAPPATTVEVHIHSTAVSPGRPQPSR